MTDSYEGVSDAGGPDGDVPGAAVVLEEARIRARAVRETMDAYSSRVSWLFAYLGVLLIALLQDASGLASALAGRVVATIAIGCIVATGGIIIWALRPHPLSGNADPAWYSRKTASSPPDEVAMTVAIGVIKAVEKDTGNGGSVRIARSRMLVAGTSALVSTGAVCAAFVVRIWG